MASGPRHLLRHVQEQFPVSFVNATQQAPKATEDSPVFPRASPRTLVRPRPLQKIWQRRGLLAVVEKVVHRNFHGSGQLFKRFNGRDRVTVLDARNIAAEQTSALFDVPLRKLL